MEFTHPFLHALYLINYVFVVMLTVCYFNHALYMVLSFFLPRKKWPKRDKLHKYAVLISARNEENVIGQLIDSLRKQDYPRELLDIFVVADNCTDKTAAVAASKEGVVVFERFDTSLVGKSYAMDFAFKRILAQYADRGYEGFFVFDADNLLSPDFVREMNNVFDAGREVVAGYRNSKNFAESWASGGCAYMHLREARQVHYCRAFFDIGTIVSGTGFLISSRYIKEFGGWPFHTLTEDVEVSAYLTTIGEKIAFNPYAVLYDEQPVDFKALWSQRMRWCKGNHQVFGKRGGALTASLLRRPTLTKWGMWVHILPLPSITFLWFVLYTLIGLVWGAINAIPYDVLVAECLSICIFNFAYPFVLGAIDGFLLFLECYREVDASFIKKFWYMILYPFTMYIFFPITCLALFANVKWTPIEHHAVLEQ